MNTAAKKGVIARFDKLDPKQKRIIALGGAAGFLVLIAALFVGSSPSAPAGSKSPNAPAATTGENLLMSADTHEMATTGVARELAELKRRVDDGDVAPAKPLPTPAGVAPPAAVDPRSQAELDSLKQELEAVRAQLPVADPPGTLTNDARPPGMPSAPNPGGYPPIAGNGVPVDRNAANAGGVMVPAGPVTIRTILPEGTPAGGGSDAPAAGAGASPAPIQKQNNGKTYYIPSGSIFSGVLTTGLDAPTGRGASSQPIPVHVRVKHEALLPNRYSAQVQEAFIVAAGYGDLSSERAYLRASTLSMVLTNGQVIDMPVQMSSVGSDGKAGLRGRLVSKQGSKVAGALFAGMADGVARAFSGNGSLSAGDGQIDIQAAGTQGAYSGAASGLNQVATYMLQQAEAQSPIIEIDAGRTVEFILLKGIEIPVQP